MATIAVIADIHGNLPALDAVLRDIADAGADTIVVNGDLADGPFPAETLDRLLDLGDACVPLVGNGDRWLVEAYDGHDRARGPEVDDLMAWAAKHITRRHRDFLAALPLRRVLDHPGAGHLGFCHATTRSDNEMFLVDSAIEHARRAFDLDTPTIFLGHSHMPFDRLFDRRRFINTGSVGMPYGHGGASWAFVGRDITLRRTVYDVDAAAGLLASSRMPGIDDFIERCVRTSFGDEEALEAFHSRMTIQQETGCFD